MVLFTATKAVVWLPQCQLCNLERYGWIVLNPNNNNTNNNKYGWIVLNPNNNNNNSNNNTKQGATGVRHRRPFRECFSIAIQIGWKFDYVSPL